LTALGEFDGLRSHLETGIERRLTRQELTEAIMHMAFYTGWLRATSALFFATNFLGSSSAGCDVDSR
jgi:4-carboxymuconolactone decarboxylase